METLTAMQSYEHELARFEKLMQANKPVLETFATHEAYTKAFNEWQMAWFCDRPNKPGYYRATND
jgi:hypothetical protein